MKTKINGYVVSIPPKPDTCEQLSRPVEADEGIELMTGEVGVVDCAIHITQDEEMERLREEHERKAKLKRLQDEHDAYRNNAETAVKRALRQYDDALVTIGEHGEVLRHDGRTTQIQ